MPVQSIDSLPVAIRASIGTDYGDVSVPTGSFLLASSAANTNAQVIATGKRQVFTIMGDNKAATTIYLKLYNKASTPTVGTDTPVARVALPVGVFQINLQGFYVSAGVGIALVTGAADSSTTAVAAGDILGLCITFGSIA